MKRNQTTLKQEVQFQGIGLHTGKSVILKVKPAKEGFGIVFQRTDNLMAKPVAALAHNISATELSTSIGNGPSRVNTIEHLMAAFAGLEIDNAMVEIDGPEMPIMDGSSAPFVEKFLVAGLARQNAARMVYRVLKPFEYRDGDKVIRVEPSESVSYDCTIDFNDSVIGQQQIDFELTPASFLQLSMSRTFCHLREVDAMRAAGLALGGSLDNAVVVTDTGVMNPEGLRNEQEFVSHKVLDCIGDLALLGAPVLGRFTLERPGHALHAKFMKELMHRSNECLQLVSLAPAVAPSHEESAVDFPRSALVFS